MREARDAATGLVLAHVAHVLVGTPYCFRAILSSLQSSISHSKRPEIFSYLQFQGSQLVIAAASALQIGLILLLIIAIEHLVGLARLARS